LDAVGDVQHSVRRLSVFRHDAFLPDSGIFVHRLPPDAFPPGSGRLCTKSAWSSGVGPYAKKKMLVLYDRNVLY
jgi:hypothetical protein